MEWYMEEERVLLHCCCGPCSLSPLETLRHEGFSVTGFFYNPNIHPYREFQSRLETYRIMAELMSLETVLEDAYGLSDYMWNLSRFLPSEKGMDSSTMLHLDSQEEDEEVDTARDEDLFGAESSIRCRACYQSRLEQTARACVRLGFPRFSTTLLVSPYQDHNAIRDMGASIATAYGLEFLYRDFRPGFREGQKKARELGFYMQGYCGCIFSEFQRYGG